MNPSSGDGLVDVSRFERAIQVHVIQPCNEHRERIYGRRPHMVRCTIYNNCQIPLFTIRDTVARSAHIIDINFMPAERIYVRAFGGSNAGEFECRYGMVLRHSSSSSASDDIKREEAPPGKQQSL
ncbi:hypothetical protein DPMN_103659 [Dreissena polymorpha]|uniref:Uncharacterized protein n=1 Tax=Dreissena polymorpha TaxID=45954 RepID=A0A9D4HA59_DREPO|nr:hypothetical protein DPMN_103659 [Dreissena polymorpha]